MIRLHRNTERRHVRDRKHEIWCTFYPPPSGPSAGRFGLMAPLDVIRIPPNGLFPHCEGKATETVTYRWIARLAIVQGTTFASEPFGDAR